MKRVDCDGTYFVYELEQMLEVYPGHPEWCGMHPTTKDFGESLVGYSRALFEKAPLAREFSACGDCWQKLGIRGTFNKRIAEKAFKSLIKHGKKGKRYRMVERTIVIHTAVLKDITTKRK